MSALHLVTAWATESGLTLGQVACEDQSNEITVIPELLKLLSLEGCTVTLDAMGCQRAIVAQIREQKADYIVGLKGNQSALQRDLQQLVEQGIDTGFKGMSKTEITLHDKGHGRQTNRTCVAVEIPEDHPQRRHWRDLQTIIAIITERHVGDKESWETRLYISSHPPKAKRLSNAIRRHWGIENSQHWVLDVTFGEDRRRQQARNGAANLAAVRRLTVSVLRQEKTNKRGVKNKRLACALDPNYLILVLQNAAF